MQQNGSLQRVLVHYTGPCRIPGLEKRQTADATLEDLAERPLRAPVLLVQRRCGALYAGTVILFAARREQCTRGGDLHMSVRAMPRCQPLLAGLACAHHVVADEQHHHFTVRDLGRNVVKVDVFGNRSSPAAPFEKHTLHAIETDPGARKIPIRLPAIDSFEFEIRELLQYVLGNPPGKTLERPRLSLVEQPQLIQQPRSALMSLRP